MNPWLLAVFPAPLLHDSNPGGTSRRQTNTFSHGCVPCLVAIDWRNGRTLSAAVSWHHPIECYFVCIVCDGAVTSEVIGQMAKEPKEPKGRSMLARASLVRRRELETNWVTANGHGSGEPSLELGTLIDAKPRTGQAGASAGSVQTPVPGCRPLTDELPGPGPLTCP